MKVEYLFLLLNVALAFKCSELLGAQSDAITKIHADAARQRKFIEEQSAQKRRKIDEEERQKKGEVDRIAQSKIELIQSRFMEAASASAFSSASSSATASASAPASAPQPANTAPTMCSVDPQANNRYSPRSNRPTLLQLGNQSDKTLLVFWITEKGEQIYQNTVEPGSSISTETYIGHVFRLIDAETITILQHVVATKGKTVVFRAKQPCKDESGVEMKQLTKKKNEEFDLGTGRHKYSADLIAMENSVKQWMGKKDGKKKQTRADFMDMVSKLKVTNDQAMIQQDKALDAMMKSGKGKGYYEKLIAESKAATKAALQKEKRFKMQSEKLALSEQRRNQYMVNNGGF